MKKNILLFTTLLLICGCQKEITNSVNNSNTSQLTTRSSTIVPITLDNYSCDGELIHFTGIATIDIKSTVTTSGNNTANERFVINTTGVTSDSVVYKGNISLLLVTSFNSHHYQQNSVIQQRYSAPGRNGGTLKYTFVTTYTNGEYNVMLYNIVQECR